MKKIIRIPFLLLVFLIVMTLYGCDDAGTGAGDVFDAHPQGTQCSHYWLDATCMMPKFCQICGATEGTVLSHNWKDATCSAPKTCTICGATEGSKLSPIIAHGDKTGPELVSFSIDKTLVEVGDVITFTAEINDSSTIYYAEFQFKCGADWHNVYLDHVGGNTYTGTLTITDTFVNGTYSISRISIQDYAENYADASSNVVFVVDDSDSDIVLDPDDTTAPELASFTLDKTNVKVGDVITFTAEIIDSSTIYYAEFQFKCGADYHNVFLENVGGNTYSGTLVITDSFVSGTYSISWISIQDYVGNDASPFSDAAFTVTN